MPDPLQFIVAFALSACASAVTVVGTTRITQRVVHEFMPIVAWACGIVIGFAVLRFSATWPPVNALQRLLMLGLPTALLIELVAVRTTRGAPGRWAIRGTWSLLLPRLVLHESSYLAGAAPRWSIYEGVGICVVCGMTLLLTQRLSFRSSQRSGMVPQGVIGCCTIAAAGLVILLGGYLRRGAAAIPFSGSMVGLLLCARSHKSEMANESLVALAITSLGGLLMVGYFFGDVARSHALILAATPGVSSLIDLIWPAKWRGRTFQATRIGLVLAVLGLVVAAAKQAFDASMGPLL